MAKPIRDPQYLAYIRTLPCLVCGTQRQVEAAHIGPHGLSQKACDRSTVPLCATHHRNGNDSLHNLGPRKFAEVHHLDLPDIAAALQARPQIRIEGAWYIAEIDGHDYPVSRLDRGLRPAVSAAVQFCMAERRHYAFRRFQEVA